MYKPKTPDPAGLSLKQVMFAEYYINGHSQVESAKLAGYSGKYIDSSAGHILKNKILINYIRDRQAEKAKSISADQQFLLDQIKRRLLDPQTPARELASYTKILSDHLLKIKEIEKRTNEINAQLTDNSVLSLNISLAKKEEQPNLETPIENPVK